jgi:hypothetical protein
MAPDNAKIDPTDKSIPPDNMTNVIPIDRHKLMEICKRTFNALSGVKKLCQKSTRPLIESETAGVPAGGEELI